MSKHSKIRDSQLERWIWASFHLNLRRNFDSVSSGVGLSLLIVALRCIGQLGVVATVLQHVFENKNPWLIPLISCEYFLLSLPVHYIHTKDTLVVLKFLGTFETGVSHIFHHGSLQLTRDIQSLINLRVASVTWSGSMSILAF